MGTPFAIASSFLAWALASSIAVSNAIARSTAGSPTIFKKPNDNIPATTPISIPRISRVPTMGVVLQGTQIHAGSLGDPETTNLPLFPKIVWIADPAGVRLVTGETEKVTPVVHELVHIHALNNRRRAFFSPDEVDRKQKNQTAKNDPSKGT